MWYIKKKLNLHVGNCVDHDVKNAPPWVQVIGSDSLGGQSVHQLVGEGLEKRTLDIAGLVAVSHVLNLAKDLQGVVHGGDHIVKAVSDALNAGIEFGISVQTVDGGISERAEFLLGAWGLLEDPFKTIELNYRWTFFNGKIKKKKSMESYLMKISATMALRSLRKFSQVRRTSAIWWGVKWVWGWARSSSFLILHKFHVKIKSQ